MYVHVPAAWISLLCFGTLSLLCIINFIFKIKSITLVYKSLAPIGLHLMLLQFLQVHSGDNQLGELGGHGMQD